ncbi:hypothetical protein ACWC9T_27425 [Kitasatospora sp. NPDC001159]
MTPEKEEDNQTFLHHAIMVSAATGMVRSLKDFQSLRGVSRGDFRALAEAVGFEWAPLNERAATGKFGEKDAGDLYRIPGEKWLAFMYEAGDPNDPKIKPGDVHHGPFVKAQPSKKVHTENGREWSQRVSGEGNPNQSSGFQGDFPELVQRWFEGFESTPGAGPPEEGLGPEMDPAY